MKLRRRQARKLENATTGCGVYRYDAPGNISMLSWRFKLEPLTEAGTAREN